MKNININDNIKDRAINKRLDVAYLLIITRDILSANPDTFIP